MLSFALGVLTGSIFPFLLYLVQRRIEGRREAEQLDRDHKRLEITEMYLANRDKWEASGDFVSPPVSIAESIRNSLTPQQWEELLQGLLLATARICSQLLRSVHTGCMYFEGIAAEYPKYNAILLAHRGEFLKWYDSMHPMRGIFDNMPPLVAKAIHAYYHRITNGTEANIEGFYASVFELQSAIDSGGIQIEDNEITRHLEVKRDEWMNTLNQRTENGSGNH